MNTLLTTWGEFLHPDHVLEEYPRPQMVRESYLNLNGFWDYAITEEGEFPCRMDGTILVPFSPETLLSRVHRKLQPDEYLWYERDLPVKAPKDDSRCILHFGAVDQCAIVFINGRKVCRHVGGYLPFEVDITDFLAAEENTLTVRVQDYSDTSYHARGKQSLHPSGMFYTAQSGIWQTVWLEWVPAVYIRDLRLTPDYDGNTVSVEVALNLASEENIICDISAGDEKIHVESKSRRFKVTLDHKISWTPESPNLYEVTVKLGQDCIKGYFAMRTYTIEKDRKGILRFCLNHQPLFLQGILDQGYWSDGLYTAPSDEALIFDLTKMKELGFNMIRKHCKIESARWYYHCDRLGMIVWQDMVNGGTTYNTPLVTWLPTVASKIRTKLDDHKYHRFGRGSKKGRFEWVRECRDTILYLSHFPCISTWVLFNEGWGQFDADLITEQVKKLDPHRLVDATSGWFMQNNSDFHSVHTYFRKLKMEETDKPYVISEYGGYDCHIAAHSAEEKAYGYKHFETVEEFQQALMRLQKEELEPLIEQGLCGAVYTQLSDVESEVNGLFTFDRKVCKLWNI
jgi:hypothetical protein